LDCWCLATSEAGTCVAACEIDADCSDGLICNPEFGICVADI
jgi:hypothetical protein